MWALVDSSLSVLWSSDFSILYRVATNVIQVSMGVDSFDSSGVKACGSTKEPLDGL